MTRQLDATMALAYDSTRWTVPLMAAGILWFAAIGTRYLDPMLWKRLPASLLAAGPPLLFHVLAMGPHLALAPFLPERAARADGPAVVVITVDALRADAAHGMRAFQRLAGKGASWERASSASSWTLPSIVSLWSGVDEPTHRAGRKDQENFALRAWSDQLPMLPSELRARGYVTAAFVANQMFGLMPFDRMFDHFRLGEAVNVPLAVSGFPGADSNGGDGADVVDDAIRFIRHAPPRGWLAWVHLYDPHLPYRHGSNRELDYNFLRNVRSGESFLGSAEQREVHKAYLTEVAYADNQLMRLIDVLQARGILEHGIVVLTADHGEEFWDHGGFEHGHSHHGEITDIPLVFIGPGVAPEQRTDLAALEDIAPTIRAMLGLANKHAVDLREPIPDSRVVHLGGNLYHGPLNSYRRAHERVIVDASHVQAYNLARDPGEQQPLSNSAELLRELSGARVREGAYATRPWPRSSAPAVGREMEIHAGPLRALGYVN